VDELERVPDGLAFDAAGNLYIACYEPSRIYRVSPERDTSLYR
jgi:gluconolactonase